MIPFNKPYLTGKETQYIEDAVKRGQISGNGDYTKKCHTYFEQTFGFKKALLTTSCTDALEMCAILADIKPGDEVIIPSYTFVSTALAFIRQGAKVVFADSYRNNPNIDASKIEALITAKTKAIVPVHYAGIACNMDAIMQLANKHNLIVIEDAAQAICSKYNGKPLGSIGHMAAFSFHETKNIISGEGGLLAINDERFVGRAEIIWEKGTNRAEFFRGEVNKYGWVDTGSSFLPSEIIAAFLYAQIENIETIQNKRLEHWHYYFNHLQEWSKNNNIQLMQKPKDETNNAHMFYLVCQSETQRAKLIAHLKANKVHAVFHYLSLHASAYYKDKHDGRALPNSDTFTQCLLRLPMYIELNPEHVVKNLVLFNE
ncbi:dTDP-4-amino-4,6-dideoxygalactose transaminase [Lacinutrix salivirga]